MKSHIDPSSKLTHKECAELANQMNEKLNKGIIKCQYLMLIAINREFHIGAKRVPGLMEKYKTVVKEFEDYAKDGVEDQKLLQSIQQILPEIKKLYH